MRKIKAVLWDLDGTLLNFKEAEAYSLQKSFDILGLGECTDAMREMYSKINLKYWQMLERGEMSKEDILVERFREFLQVYQMDDTKAEALRVEYESHLGDIISLEEDALKVVEALHGKVQQYIVTNGRGPLQKQRLADSGIDKWMDGVFISDEIGIEKPMKGFFDVVLEAIEGVKPEEMVIIGDSLTSDMQGGNNAGILCCWYNPKHAVCEKELRIDYEIDSLAQVLTIIE